MIDLKKLILSELNKKDRITSRDIIQKTNFSRTYVNRFLSELESEGKIIRLGKARQSFYIKTDKKSLAEAKANLLSVNKTLENKNLSEDTILDQIKRETGIFDDINENVVSILNYSFTEMMNNAIDHSCSKFIDIKMSKNEEIIRFDIIDKGVGVFNNIMKKNKLNNRLEAIQDLLKGKQTTMPKKHSGEGIFFTSKIADSFVIESSDKKLLFNNIVDDVFVYDIKNVKGSKVTFVLSMDSKKEIGQVFKRYAGSSFEFSKTKVNVKLYKIDTDHVSRSQARRIVSGLDKFDTVILDFKNIKTVGQAFADEIFRVWQNNYPKIKIISQNANENILFMINRALER